MPPAIAEVVPEDDNLGTIFQMLKSPVNKPEPARHDTLKPRKTISVPGFFPFQCFSFSAFQLLSSEPVPNENTACLFLGKGDLLNVEPENGGRENREPHELRENKN